MNSADSLSEATLVSRSWDKVTLSEKQVTTPLGDGTVEKQIIWDTAQEYGFQFWLSNIETDAPTDGV